MVRIGPSTRSRSATCRWFRPYHAHITRQKHCCCQLLTMYVNGSHSTARGKSYYLRRVTKAWQASGLGTLQKKTRWLSEPIDMYRRPYEGIDIARGAMQGYLDWEVRLVA
ncbi:hypothetical protein F5Y16DRAFT_385549 [Xylariaceae sp. FL0255]|nr:hypothetical protein F5Y16DRAFT_385549 [Xylariaceae sp. FL0255]